MQNYKSKFIQLTLWLAFATTFISGQKTSAPTEIIQVETNAVFIEALVRDKSTGEPVTNLQREDFILKVDNKPREITEFSFDGKTNCPLTIILFFNLAPNGALKYLEQPKAQKSLGKALSSLNENDEVTILTTKDWFIGKPQVLLDPTKNHSEIAKTIAEATNGVNFNQSTNDKFNKRTMSDAIDLVGKISDENPVRKIALIYISDGVNTLDMMEFAKRKKLVAQLLRKNISFSALNFALSHSYQAAANIINPLGYVFCTSVTGSQNYLAKESGGVSINVSKAEDFGTALEKMINLYGSRYSLGFYLDENEKIDRKPHKLEVKIKVKKGFLLSTKRSFYFQ